MRPRSLPPVSSLSRPAPRDTVIVIPCFNEAERLKPETFLAFVDAEPAMRLLFVDDGSSDDTLDTLARLRVARPDAIDVLVMAENSGKAEAVRQGLLHACASDARLVGYLDADLATPLDAMEDFRRVMNRLDDVVMVFGSRKAPMGHRIERHVARRMVSSVCAGLARVATGLPIRDTQCGAKLFRNEAVLRAALSVPFRADWLFDVEIFLRLSGPLRGHSGAFFEYPLVRWQDVAGSHIRSTTVLRSGVVMLGLIANQWRIRKSFRRKLDRLGLSEAYVLRPHGTLLMSDVAALAESLTDTLPVRTVVDLRAVRTLGPSVMTALFGLCDRIVLSGSEVSVFLPVDGRFSDSAERTGLSASFDCRELADTAERSLTARRNRVRSKAA